MEFIIKKLLNMVLTVSKFSPFALIWMAKAFLIDWPLRKWSFFQLPRKADEMGLNYVESDYEDQIGIIKGKINDYYIEIKPDNSMNSSIKVFMHKRNNNLEISLGKIKLRPSKNICDFTTDNWKFNLAFKTKRAHVNSIENLLVSNELFDSLAEFYNQWIFRLESLVIDNGELCAKFRYGFYFFPYIPVYKIEEIVNQLVKIAEIHDEVFNR